MTRDDLTYLIEARHRFPLAICPDAHYAMSLETLRDVAEECCVDIPEDWEPSPDDRTQIMGIPVALDATMPRGAWAIHVACSPHSGWPSA